MSELARVVPLMYRPRWPELTLSGQVSSYDKAGPHFEAFERRGRLWLAPGGRYRADLADEDGDRSLDICDGQSLWVAHDGVAGRGGVDRGAGEDQLVGGGGLRGHREGDDAIRVPTLPWVRLALTAFGGQIALRAGG